MGGCGVGVRFAGFGVEDVPQCAGVGCVGIDDEEGVGVLGIVGPGAEFVVGDVVVFSHIPYRDCVICGSPKRAREPL